MLFFIVHLYDGPYGMSSFATKRLRILITLSLILTLTKVRGCQIKASVK